MKIAIAGKGGAGKTTISALVCRALDAAGREVIALDGDSNANLACALGIPGADEITPLSEMADLIREKTGAEKGRYGAYFKMNPDVADIPGRFKHTSGRIQLLVMGSVTQAGGGCVCPAYVLIKHLVAYLLPNSEQDFVVDMEAGLEHLGRGVTEKVDALLVVVRPTRVSRLTALRIHGLAKDLKIPRIAAVGNGIRNSDDERFLRDGLPGIELLACFPFSEELAAREHEGTDGFAIKELKDSAEALLGELMEVRHG